MKIIEKSGSDSDYRSFMSIEVINCDGTKKKISFKDGEPEDASLSRDFSDAFSIVSLMKAAYECGKSGDKLEIEYFEQLTPDEFWAD